MKDYKPSGHRQVRRTLVDEILDTTVWNDIEKAAAALRHVKMQVDKMEWEGRHIVGDGCTCEVCSMRNCGSCDGEDA